MFSRPSEKEKSTPWVKYKIRKKNYCMTHPGKKNANVNKVQKVQGAVLIVWAEIFMGRI